VRLLSDMFGMLAIHIIYLSGRLLFKEEVGPVRNLHTILQEIYTSLLEIYVGGLSRYWEMHTSQ